MLIDELRSQMISALKSGDEIKKNILRVVLGDFSTIEARNSGNPTKVSQEDSVRKIVKKLIEGNIETLKFCSPSSDAASKLTTENTILSALLPKTLTKEEIKGYINFSSTMIVSDIKGARSDGQATGVLIKWLKQSEINNFEGSIISEIVKEIRSDVQ